MRSECRVAIDCMSGDHGAEVAVPAALQALKSQGSLHLILVGDEAAISRQLQTHSDQVGDCISILHTDQVIQMNESPASVLRGKPKSSMHFAIDQVACGRAQACVSAGNTGALMAIGLVKLRRLPGIDRPAILAQIPDSPGHVWFLDLGANLQCDENALTQFATMGSAFCSLIDRIAKPRVALLNIGSESIKGLNSIKKASALLEKSQLNYVGFIEADGFWSRRADVIVCDGFTGNIALKTMEGTARKCIDIIKSLGDHWLCRLPLLLLRPRLRKALNLMDPSSHNGATLIGLNGIVVKSHGGSNQKAFANAIETAIEEIRSNSIEALSSQTEAGLRDPAGNRIHAADADNLDAGEIRESPVSASASSGL